MSTNGMIGNVLLMTEVALQETHSLRAKKVNVYPDTLGLDSRLLLTLIMSHLQEIIFGIQPIDDYPVVGVDWHMANAFCYWRTNLWNAFQK